MGLIGKNLACAAFCGRICVGHTEPPGGVLAKIFYQMDSVRSTFLCVRFYFTMILFNFFYDSSHPSGERAPDSSPA